MSWMTGISFPTGAVVFFLYHHIQSGHGPYPTYSSVTYMDNSCVLFATRYIILFDIKTELNEGLSLVSLKKNESV